MLCVRVEKPTDHALVLWVVLPRFALKELDAALAQGDGHLDPLLPEDEVVGGAHGPCGAMYLV
jgi:hypothetical protein